MKANQLTQVLYDMKHQPVIGIVTVLGTALSIFLIMIVVMMHLVHVVPFAPESNRSRLLYGKFLHLTDNDGGDMSAGMTYATARDLYDNLDDAEAVSFYQTDANRVDVSTLGSKPYFYYLKKVDTRYWDVFDYKFTAGRPFNTSEFDGGARVAAISETVARQLFGSVENAPGKEMLISQVPHRVVGVFEDASPLANQAFSEIMIPFTINGGDKDNWANEYFGPFMCAILVKDGASFDGIRAQVQQRKDIFNQKLAKDGYELVDHGSPFTQEQINNVPGSNTDAQDDGGKFRLIIYVILLIVPAINLSSMTQSRLRRRTSEIGVRRAFGCTRLTLVKNILIENFIVTLVGGALGLICCLIFGYFFSDMVFTDLETSGPVNVSLGLLLNWQVFGLAILFCFILNILSSGIPAWRAARTDVVDAINSRNI